MKIKKISFALKVLTCLMVVFSLGSCQEDDSSGMSTTSETGNDTTTDTGTDTGTDTTNGTITPPTPPTLGVGWSDDVALQVDGVHGTVLPNGKVLYLPHRETLDKKTMSVVFDPYNPAAAKYIEVPNNHFCGGHSQLSDGRVLFVGGEQDAIQKSAIFDYVTETWTASGDLQKRRWYPSSIQLGDGSVWTVGGQNEAAEVDANDNTIETYDVNSGSWTLAGGQDIPGQHEEAYPRVHLLPDGRIFQSGHLPDTHIYDPLSKTWTFVATTQLGWPRGDGASVRLQDGRFMLIGGQDEVSGQFTRTSEIIDLSEANPQWRYVAEMHTLRAFNDAIVLPDGKVLMVGGDETSGPMQNNPELYDPATDTWTLISAHKIFRAYHSTTLLLPDARVIVGGGDGNTHHNPTGLYNESGSYEIWTPPYLEKTARPQIMDLAQQANYGAELNISYQSEIAVDKVVFHRGGVQTHSFAYNHVSHPVTLQNVNGSSATLTVPDNANLLPPGYYMVFLMSTDGVPSEANWVRIGS